MSFREFCQQINFAKECRKYGLGIWQCPNFLFVVMGGIIILAVLVSYFIAIQYIVDPLIVLLIVLGLSVILIIIGYFIINNFERLAQVNQIKSEFIGVASHQLRTPLSGLKWSLNLLLGGRLGQLNEEQLGQLRMIKRNNDRMIKLVNDLLDVSRMEQGRIDLRPEKIDLAKIIQDLIKDYSFFLEANNVTLTLEKPDKMPLVSADPQRIKLVVQNLLDNAVRYIKDKGSVKIRLIEDRNFLRCEVEDSGVGIPTRDQGRIFQKFFRSQNILKYRTEGTGLGLFIAKNIIRASGGKINFKSKENNGSTFWFELPIKS